MKTQTTTYRVATLTGRGEERTWLAGIDSREGADAVVSMLYEMRDQAIAAGEWTADETEEAWVEAE